jgi:4-carboxymuconolactone decarboxylase
MENKVAGKKRATEEILDELMKSRGHVLPVHRLMAELDPHLLARYMELSQFLIFDEARHALDLKTRFLVMVGITTAVKGDPEGVEWSSARAIKYGATREEVAEAALLAMLPAGVPSVEKVAPQLLEAWAADRKRPGGKPKSRKAGR